jgi:gamma-glutamylcyclotransferase (GGCT)/AIG2-like uncharacterized protein YtfP
VDGPHGLFVYGTLQPGYLRWPILARFADGEPKAASAAGRLFDTKRGYPAARFDGMGRVPGVVVGLRRDDAAEALRTLDHIEGVKVDLFRRVQVVTDAGISVWSYEWAGPTRGMTPIDRWV